MKRSANEDAKNVYRVYHRIVKNGFKKVSKITQKWM
jgi:hypothetical protein